MAFTPNPNLFNQSFGGGLQNAKSLLNMIEHRQHKSKLQEIAASLPQNNPFEVAGSKLLEIGKVGPGLATMNIPYSREQDAAKAELEGLKFNSLQQHRGSQLGLQQQRISQANRHHNERLNKRTTSQQDFEYAIKNGYKGTFADYKKLANPGTTVNVGNQDISKIKEGPAKAAGFYERMLKSGKEASSIEGINPAAGRNTLEGIWQNLAPNEWQSPKFQQYKNASAEWIRAKLRKESGAVIGADEMAEEFRTYFPVPGDSPEVVKQKARFRATAERSMQAESRGAHDALFPEDNSGWTVKVK